MIINNNEKMISNIQLEQIFKLLGEEYKPSKINVYEKKTTMILESPLNVVKLYAKVEAFYNPLNDTLELYFYNADGSKEDKQLYTIYEMIKAVRGRYYYNDEVKDKHFNLLDSVVVNDTSNTLELIQTEEYEYLIKEFAKKFMDDNSEKISDIMGWKDEWEVEEED